MPETRTGSENHLLTFPKASPARLEVLFFTCLSLAILGSYLGLTSPPLVTSLVVLSLGLVLLLWPRGEAQLFSATRSTCARYKTVFLELCALIYILCAALSIYARLQARNFRSNVMLVLLREQAITSIWKIDLIACAAIVVSHLTGHHDICDRIHRRVLWFGIQIQRFSGGLCDVFIQMFQEPDLERQSMVGISGAPTRQIATTPKEGQGTNKNHGGTVHRLVDGPGALTLQERFRNLRSLSMSPDSYSFLHQEIRSISAQLRWAALRDRYVYHKPPMQDFLSLAASQARVGSTRGDQDDVAPIGPMLQTPPRSRRASTRGHSPSLSLVVSDVVNLHKALNAQGPWPSQQAQQLLAPTASQRNLIPTPVFQLPGTIESICVKALPDTGSSQNVIDKNLVQSLFPCIPVHPVDESTDNLLVAPDRQPIPCIGKILLSWMFKGESQKHRRWFYVVENCSKGVIIGNGFLRQTETMSKHRHRLELTRPSESYTTLNHLRSEGVNEARQDECLRQLVFGRINDTEAVASLDTGCEANLMSFDYAESLQTTIMPLPSTEQHVKYADGRQDNILGQVEVDWRFSDTSDKAVKVIFYVLGTCIHPVIFGQHFIFSEDPWIYHEAALIDCESEPAVIGVVGLEKVRRRFLGLLGGYKPDPQEEARQREKRERKERAVALLQTQMRTRSAQQQAQNQAAAPAVPPPAVLAPANQPAPP